jgi:DNA-binding transcriptional ArsR family regulator
MSAPEILPEFDRPEVDRLVEALRLMGHPLRLSILRMLAQGESAVGEIAERTGQSLSLISQQLALLRKAGLVQTRREAKQVFYALAGARLGVIASSLQSLAGASADTAVVPPVLARDPARIGAALFARIEPRL